MPKVISQLAALSMPKKDIGFATHIFMPNRNFFNGVFRASVNMAKDGSYGLLFRYIDQFNYYGF